MYRAKRLAHVLTVLAIALLVVSGCVPKIAAKPTHAPVTLRFGYREYTADFENLLAEFQEEYSWVTVEPVMFNRFGYDDLERTVENGGVDVFCYGTSALGLAGEGLLHPLDDMQVAAWDDYRDDYYDNAWEALTVDGQLWGVPAALDMMVAYVNLDQAKALDVDVPQADWDLFQFLDLAMQMNYPEGTPYSSSVKLWGLCTDPRNIDPVLFIYLYGGSIVDDLNSPTEPTLDNIRTIEAVDWYVSLFNDYQVAPDVNTIRTAFRRGGVYEAAARGVCGTWLGWYSNRGGMDIGYDWGLDYAILPMPSVQVDFGMGDVDGYFITKDCPDPEAALELAQFLGNHTQSSGTKLPVRKSLTASDEYKTLVGDELHEQVQTLADDLIIIPVETMAMLEGVGGALVEAVQYCIEQDIPSDGPLGEAQREVEAIMAAQ